MSMKFVSYVGPYLKIEGLYEDWYDLIGEDKLCGLRGELYDGTEYLGLNTDIEGVLSLNVDGLTQHSPVDFSQLDIEEQKQVFEEFLKEEIGTLEIYSDSVELCWGIVPGYF